jgi:hypothetical protein
VPAPSASSTSTASRTDRRRRGGVAGQPRAGQDQGGGSQVRHRPRHHRPGRQPGAARSGRGDPVHSHADARRADPGLPAAGKHVQVEIPLCDVLADGEGRAWRRRRPVAWWPCAATRAASTPATSGCTTRSLRGEFNIQQMDVQTYFFRRTNMNALGQPRSWTDHLLWHHAAHTVDLFPTRRQPRDRAGQRHPGAHPPDAGHRDGHEHPAQGQPTAPSARCRSASTTTGRWAPSSATSATPAPTSPATTTCSRQGREDRRQPGGGVDERHRAAGPRVLRRHPRRPRAQQQRGPGAALLPGAAPAGAAAEPMPSGCCCRRWMRASRCSTPRRCTASAPMRRW